jgi:hypothetical protein
MNILMITTNDPAGVGINFTDAINRYTSHRCRLITTEIRYNFYYKKDLHIPWISDFSEVEQLLKTAEIYHFHMVADEYIKIGPFRPVDFLDSKKIVQHHHGEPLFRANPEKFLKKEKMLGRKAVVSTPDLLRVYPGASWIPNPVPLSDELYLPYNHTNGRGDKIFIGHSPTRKELKNTKEFLEVVGELKSKGLNVEPVIIENTPHRKCLKTKQKCDVFFDHMQGYFGVSSLEALSQGIPTIAGLDDWCISWIKSFTGCKELPWIIARNKDELKEVLLKLTLDNDLRRFYKTFSRQWIERYWNEKSIIEALIDFYINS